MEANGSSSEKYLFDQIKNNRETGKYQEVYDVLQQLRANKFLETLSVEEQVLYLTYEAESLFYTGKIQQAEQLLRDAKKTPDLQTTSMNRLALAQHQYILLLFLGNMQQVEQLGQDIDQLIDSLSSEEKSSDTGKYWIAHYYNNKATLYFSQNESVRAKHWFQQCIVLLEQVKNQVVVSPYDMISPYNDLAVIYRHMGEPVQALQFLTKALSISRQYANPSKILLLTTNIAGIYITQANFDPAWELLQEAHTVAVQVKSPYHLNFIFDTFGYFHLTKGELEQSLNYFQQSLALLVQHKKELSLTFRLRILAMLVIIAVEMQKLELAQTYFEQLQAIPTTSLTVPDHLQIKICEALLLKSNRRMTKKAQAQEMLSALLLEEKLYINDRILGIYHLCELLLDELRNYEELEVLAELSSYITQLFTLAEQHHMILTTGDALILQAKLAVLDNKLEEGLRLLEQAEHLSLAKGLLQIQKKVGETKQELVQLMEQQPGSQLQDTPLGKKLELMKMDNYLKVARRHIELGSSSTKEEITAPAKKKQ